MNSKFLRICSMILTIVMVFNMLPAQALGEMIFTEKQSVSATDETLSADATVTNSTDSAEIVEEIEENRTEYSKEFKLSNGLHMAVVYGDPVHYDNNGKWDEIDNTLKATTNGTYTNTAGVWDVSLPQQMTATSPVTITKDGYTLSFVLAGELNKSSDAVVMSEQAELSVQGSISAETEGDTQPFAVASTQSSRAQVVDLNYESYKATAEYEETVVEKRQSRLLYSNVYSVTDITYDLSSNQVKESIIMHSYKEALRGYKYTLNVGNLVPVLGEDGHIDFYNKDKTKIIMVMPAPFLMDAGYSYNADIAVQLVGKGSTYTLTYTLPQNWLKDESRQWPVILDPMVESSYSKENIDDRNVYSLTAAGVGDGSGVLQCGYHRNVGKSRAYLRYEQLPVLSPADVIVEAYVSMYKPLDSGADRTVYVHRVTETWGDAVFGWSNMPKTDSKVEDYVVCQDPGYYTWNITDIARGWYEGENTGMMFKLSDTVENTQSNCVAQFYSSDYDIYQTVERPIVTIKFRNNNGLEDYWNYTSASAGRAGTGHVNDYTGNLVWIRDDIGFGGNRAPVSISHVYNANDTVVNKSSNNSMDTSGNAFGMGYGWRTNFNQLIDQWTTKSNYYVWEDDDGTDHYFEYDEEKAAYVDEDNLNLTLAVTEDGYTITHKYGAVDYFDSYGRLYKQENNQETKSSIQVYYTTDSGKLIDYITDGVGRKYDFTYNESGMLTRISYLGSEEYQEAHANQADREISYVTYAYDANNNLISVTDKDGKTSSYSYILNGHLLTSAQDIDGYTLTYTYTKTEAGKPSRIETINESHNNVQGSSLTLTYAHNQTTFTDHNGNKQISQFNDYGNTVSMQDGLGRAQHAKFTFNTPSDAAAAKEAGTTSAKSNQLAVASKMQNTVRNFYADPSFENQTASGSGNVSFVNDIAYMGNKSLRAAATVSTGSVSIPAGESYTLSAWVKTENTTAKLTLGTAESTVLEKNTDWTRLEATYDNKSQSAVSVVPRLVTEGVSYAYMDCIQLENMPTASRYNLIDNGDFSNSLTRWTGSNYTLTTTTSGAPQLDNNMVTVSGDPSATRQLTQTVQVSGKQGDTFVLAGWAKGDSVPLSDTRTFGIIGTFNYTDGTTGNFTASFNPDTYPTDEENAVVWQYTAAPMVAKQDYSSITVKLSYDYNANTVYFDGIQLFKETFGQSYDYDDDGNIKSIVDLQNAKTTYEYTGNDLTKEILPTGAEMTYTYDAYHNVLSATTAENLVYNFVYDTYGNNTSVSISSEAGTKITSSAHYSEDGNRLEYTTDALDKDTLYDYDAETNVLKSVQFPEDTAATKTTYTYDEMYRNARIAATTNTGLAMSAEYTYTDDVMTRIKTPTTTYNFEYGNFGLRKGVYILDAESTDDPQYLAEYTYTNRNNYLDTIDYGNGDKVQYEYDSYGRLLTETYEDNDVVSYQYDNDGGLAAVTDSETGITTRYYYDFSGRATGYSETGTDFSHTVGYEYDTSNNMTSYVETIDGQKRTSSYTYNDDNRITSVTVNGITVEYVYDSFDRLTQKTTKNGDTVVLTEYYTFKEVDNTTSNQIWKYRTKSDKVDITYEYAYDDNGNITSIYDGTNWKYYTYDSANQLTREDNQERGRTYTWTYDSAGNILSYKTYYYNPTQTDETKLTSVDTAAYSYSEGEWKDLLTSFDGNAITYDGMGNPLTYGTTEFTWEHGRQLASMTKNGVEWTYTYSNTGLRTSRSNGTTTYKYVYDGSVLKQMTIVNETDKTQKIVGFTYDATGSPLTMTYDGATYYYITNMQGDVVGLLDGAGNRIISYQYTAYGQGRYISHEPDMAAILSTVNPIGYRGYVMDVGTATYYCQSRYYDPAIGRFINADGFPATGQGLTGNNMFAYCGNNPVNRQDDGGEFWNIVIGAVTGAVVSGVVSIATQAIENNGFKNINWKRVGVAAASGAVSGSLAATGIPVGGQVIANGIIGAVSGGVDTYVDKGENATFKDYATNIVSGGVIGMLGGKMGGNGTGTKHLSRSAGRLLNKSWTAVKSIGKNGLKATGKTILNAGKYYYSQVAKQSLQCGIKSILPIIASNIPNAIYNIGGACSRRGK